MYNGGDPNIPRVLLLAPTGVAALNIHRTTIHFGLSINCKGKFYSLNDKQRASLRNKLSEVVLLIIYEISIVSRTLFYQINLGLIEIFGINKLSGITCGDFYQLPHVNLPAIYSQLDLKKVTVKDWLNGLELWYLFQMAELTVVMRQRGDTRLTEMLNKIRVGDVDDALTSLLKSRLAVQKEISYPIDTLNLFAKNAPADAQNKLMINQLIQNVFLLKPLSHSN